MKRGVVVVSVGGGGRATTVETGKDEVGKWWVQIAPLAGIRECCLNFSKVKCRLCGAYGRTLVACFEFDFFAERNRRAMVGITFRASGKIESCVAEKSRFGGDHGTTGQGR